jgi:DNA repair protein RecN (Recombination protein N)
MIPGRPRGRLPLSAIVACGSSRLVLDFLRIRGLALLDDVALEFEPGMNVLTGETGAGKSIIVDALTLLRGGRGRAELVREGAEAARVEAQFTVRGRVGARLQPLLDEHGLELEDDQLVVERRVKRSGRGRIALQSNLTTVMVLAEVGGELLEICSQHEHHSLTHVGHHLELLDAYAELDAELAEYGEHYRAWRALAERIADIRAREAERLQRADYLRFQIEELERVDPRVGEYDEARGRLALLREAGKLHEFASATQQILYESDDALAGRLGMLIDRARRLPRGSRVLDEVVEQLEAAKIACEEASGAAARLADAIELGPGELEQLEERVHELERLRRKHGGEVDELVGRLEAMRAELATLDSTEDQLGILERDEAKQRERCREWADRLHAERLDAAAGLARAVETELEALHMPGARLAVELHELGQDEGAGEGSEGSEGNEANTTRLGPRGRDRAEIRFSANPGEPLAPLNRVASGGELSRVLLAVKSVLSNEQRVATYVFDEVDAGVGGAVAEAIGLRLRRAAADHQVLCITHLPQIAAFADAHFRVHKTLVEGRTVTKVERLGDDERIDELARMLGGKKVTASAREHARALHEHAREAGSKKRPRKPAAGQAARSKRGVEA